MERRKKLWRYLFVGCAALGAVELLGNLAGKVLLWLYQYGHLTLGTEAASVGIIGGADGPTAVFVAYSTPVWYQYVLPVLLIAVGILGYRRLSKGK